ncbi:MAG TPA: hypothetical protein VEH31_30290 [Streptosporangiaceae bacterium]|nr:hypothetical protein [Streptosporangiaceae bacterium]
MAAAMARMGWAMRMATPSKMGPPWASRPGLLRSLDAIHLATARILAPELDAFVSYDDRLLRAATDAASSL